MRAVFPMAAAGIALAALAQPAAADVKAGVDAWQAGDYARAIAEWQTAAQAGDPDAQFNLGQAYKLGRGVPMDMARATQFYRLAAAQGHEQAQANLGLVLFQSGDRPGAMPWLQKAADRGEPRAQYVLGTAFFNGDMVKRDYVRAYAFMTQAASAGLPQAATSLSQMDGYIPLPDRKKGIALAEQMGRTRGAPSTQLAAAEPVRAPVPVAPPPRSAAPGVSYPAPGTPVATTPVPASVRPRPEPAPAPVSAPAPRPAPATGGAWRVQFGAFRSAEAARHLWEQLHARHAALASSQPFLVSVGAVTRLQAGPFATKAAADQACSAARSGGQDCFSVKP